LHELARIDHAIVGRSHQTLGRFAADIFASIFLPFCSACRLSYVLTDQAKRWRQKYSEELKVRTVFMSLSWHDSVCILRWQKKSSRLESNLDDCIAEVASRFSFSASFAPLRFISAGQTW